LKLTFMSQYPVFIALSCHHPHLHFAHLSSRTPSALHFPSSLRRFLTQFSILFPCGRILVLPYIFHIIASKNNLPRIPLILLLTEGVQTAGLRWRTPIESQRISDKKPVSKGDIIEEAQSHGYDLEDAERELNKLLRSGVVAEVKENHYQSVGRLQMI